MRIYAFDLLPWPYLEAPSLYPDPNSLFDPVKGHIIYEQHLRQIEYLEECGFDGVQLDYEICPDEDPNFLSLLEECRDAIPNGDDASKQL